MARDDDLLRVGRAFPIGDHAAGACDDGNSRIECALLNTIRFFRTRQCLSDEESEWPQKSAKGAKKSQSDLVFLLRFLRLFAAILREGQVEVCVGPTTRRNSPTTASAVNGLLTTALNRWSHSLSGRGTPVQAMIGIDAVRGFANSVSAA